MSSALNLSGSTSVPEAGLFLVLNLNKADRVCLCFPLSSALKSGSSSYPRCLFLIRSSGREELLRHKKGTRGKTDPWHGVLIFVSV